MAVNQDYKDLFKILYEEKVEYLIVGAHAVVYYTQPRYTKDLDIWINPTLENSKKIWKSLKLFGAPLLDIEQNDFLNSDLIYQIGIEPNRIDLITDVTGLAFEDAFQNKIISNYDGIQIYILDRTSLIKNKSLMKRKQDEIDLESLNHEQ